MFANVLVPFLSLTHLSSFLFFGPSSQICCLFFFFPLNFLELKIIIKCILKLEIIFIFSKYRLKEFQNVDVC